MLQKTRAKLAAEDEENTKLEQAAEINIHSDDEFDDKAIGAIDGWKYGFWQNELSEKVSAFMINSIS